MNGTATTWGVFKAYAFFIFLGLPSLDEGTKPADPNAEDPYHVDLEPVSGKGKKGRCILHKPECKATLLACYTEHDG